MMGQRQVDQAALFYEFSLERHVPATHLLRSIDRFVDLSDVRRHLAPFYSCTGRPSIDPELLVRMLLVGPLAMKSIQFVTDVHTLAAYVMNSIRAGHTAEAQQAVAQLLKLQPNFRASHAREVFPARLPEESHRITTALRDAGLPD
jgi:hypothetical protein